MSELSITSHWQRAEPALRPGEFSSAHTVRYNEQTQVPVDAAPDWGGDPAKTNPEQALAAAVSSCHMMTFLALAAKAGWPVASFEDRAVAHLGKGPGGRTAANPRSSSPSATIFQAFSFAFAWALARTSVSVDPCGCGIYIRPVLPFVHRTWPVRASSACR